MDSTLWRRFLCTALTVVAAAGSTVSKLPRPVVGAQKFIAHAQQRGIKSKSIQWGVPANNSTAIGDTIGDSCYGDFPRLLALAPGDDPAVLSGINLEGEGVDCTWGVRVLFKGGDDAAKRRTSLIVRIEALGMEDCGGGAEDGQCGHCGLSFTDGDNESAWELGTFCRKRPPPPTLTTAKGALKIRFRAMRGSFRLVVSSEVAPAASPERQIVARVDAGGGRRRLQEVGSFAELKAAIDDAPSDGTQVVVDVVVDLLWNAEEITVASGKNISIRGAEGQLRVLQAMSSGARRHFVVSGALFLENLEIKGGSDGGAVFVTSGSAKLYIEDCTFSGEICQCWFTTGGAVSAANGAKIVAKRCNFEGNSAEGGLAYGGAVHLYGAIFDATSCEFQGNIAGGAVYISGSDAFSATNCTFQGNMGVNGGGAVYISNGAKFDAIGSSFQGNTASKGGAIYTQREFSAMGCTFQSNVATTQDANVYRFDAQSKITQCDDGFDCGAGADCVDHPNTGDEWGFECRCSQASAKYQTGGCAEFLCPAMFDCNSSFNIYTLAPCPAGHACAEGSPRPQLCSRGTFAPTIWPTQCQSCPARRYCPDNGTATPLFCPVSSFCPPESITPISCPSGTFSRYGNLSLIEECDATCPRGHYCTPGSPTPTICPAKHYCPIGSEVPTACADPPGAATSSHTGLYSLDECNSNCTLGHYCPTSETDPIPCQRGYYCRLGASNQTLCLPGTYCPDPQLSTWLECPAGSYCEDTGIVDPPICAAGTFCPRGSSAETPCPAGRWSDAANATSIGDCRLCQPGKFGSVAAQKTSENLACANCQTGTYSPAPGGALNCTACPTGRSAGIGSPMCFYLCALGEYTITDSTCASCPAGTYGDQIGGAANASECKPCTRGAYCTGGSSQELCPRGRWSRDVGAPSDASCVACPEGTFSSARGADSPESCNACPPGKYGSTVGAPDAAACVPCDAGSFSRRSGQTSCDLCTSGSSAEGSAFCAACEAGTEYNADTKLCIACSDGWTSAVGQQCHACAPGSYDKDRNHTRCALCPAGRWSNATGALGIAACAPCAAGTFSSAAGVDAAHKCSACPPGTSSSDKGAASSATCHLCEPSFFAAMSGQTACAPCVSGSSGRGSSFCVDCAAGTELNPATKVCDTCPPGSTSSVGTRCVQCSAGYFEKNRDVCSPCPPGKFGSYSAAESVAACAPCAAGTFSSAAGVNAASKCNACPPGKSSSEQGADSSAKCRECNPNFFAANNGQTACAQCTSGTSGIGSSFCTNCAAGLELVNGTCHSCAAGKTSTSGGACSNCEEGRFAPEPGSDTCTRCPDFMTSLPNDATHCVAAKGYVLGRVLSLDSQGSGINEQRRRLQNTSDGEAERVHPCPANGAVCDFAGARVELLVLLPGFTRPTDLSLDVVPCLDNLAAVPNNASVCEGGLSTGRLVESICRTGTAGPYCATCAEGYTRQSDDCVICAEYSAAEVIAPLLTLLGIASAAALLGYAVYKWWLKKKKTRAGAARHRKAEKVKVTLGFVQVVSGIIDESDLQYPPFFTSMIASLSVFSFDLFDFLSVGCIVPTSFYGELAATCVAPLVLAGLVGAYTSLCSPRSTRNWKESFMELYLVVLFCVYPGVTRKIFNTFKCDRFLTRADGGGDECAALDYTWEDGARVGVDGWCFRRFLRADLALSCDADVHTGWKVFAGFMALLYPVGVPALFAWLLLRSNGEDPSLTFIRVAYRDDYYWWELVELGRKLVITFVLVFFMEGSASQIVATMLVSCASFAVLRAYKPYKLQSDDILAAVAQALLVLVSLGVLCIKVHVAENEWNESALDVAMSATVTTVPVLALLLALEVQLVKRSRTKARVANEKLENAEGKVEEMKEKLRVAQKLVDQIMGEEGGSLLASYAIKHADLAFDVKIGEGSFGEVWKGTLRGVETVAIKTMRVGKIAKSALRKFKVEILVMAPLRHANLVCMLGAVWDEGADKLCLVLEFAAKGALDGFMKMPDFTPALGRRLVLDVALCLKYLHHDLPHHVLHRDIKQVAALVVALNRSDE